MAANIADYFGKYSNGSQPIPTTLSAQKLAGATTASLTTATGWDTTTVKHVRMYTTTVSGSQTIPNQSSICIYKATLSGTTLSNLTLVWSATGSDQTYAAGATVDLAVTPAYTDALATGALVEHGQDGTHSTALITSRTEDTDPDPDADFVLTYDDSATALKKAKISNLISTDGWIENVLPSVSSVTANGNRSYDITFSSSVASILSSGMRLRTTRTVAAPAGSFYTNGSTDYFTKTSPTGMAFTTTFTCSAWINLTAYGSANTYILGRSDATPANAWGMYISSSGQLSVGIFNGGAANWRLTSSYQSVPLNKWVHVAVTYNSGTVLCYIDGVSVPVQASTTSGTAPTATVQAGDYSVGRLGSFVSATSYFPGRIAQAAVFSSVLTQANIRSYLSQGLSGSESTVVVAHSGANLTDLTANANTLTAAGTALSGQGYSPFGNNYTSTTLDYALVMSVSGSTATVQVPEGCTIPTSGGVTSVAYSVQGNPYGWVSDKGRWKVASLLNTSGAITSNATYGSFISNGWGLVVPVGAWDLVWQVGLYNTTTTAVALNLSSTALTGLTIAQGVATSRYQAVIQSTAAATLVNTVHIRNTQTLSVATPFLVYSCGATTSAGVDGSAVNEIFAEPAGL